MKIKAVDLKDFSVAVLKAAGLSEEEALHTAHSMGFAQLRGVERYGFADLPAYVGEIESGMIRTNVRIEIVSEMPAALLIDGKGGIGPFVCRKCMDMCIERARENGSCTAVIRNVSAPGLGAYFARYAMEKNCMTFLMSDCGRDEEAQAMFGLPTGKGYPPVIVDTDLPAGTECVSEAFSLMLEGTEAEVFLGAVALDRFMPYADYLKNVQGMIGRMKSGDRVPLLPGEAQHNSFHILNESGIEVSKELQEKLQELGSRFGIPFPEPVWES